MAKQAVTPLQRQLTRVSRRLFFQTLLDSTIWACVAALFVATLWFFIQPNLLEKAAPWLRWAVAGGIAGVALLTAVIWTIVKAPSRLVAALSLDERFELKERVTTSLTLGGGMEHTPAGRALLADVNQRIDKLDVSSRFPLKMSWTASLVPACALLLVAVAFFYEPTRIQANLAKGKDKLAEAPANAQALEQKMKDLSRKNADKERPEGIKKSEDIEKLEAELEKIAQGKRDTKEELRERIKEMTALEEAMRNKEREMTEKSRSLKSQLQQLEKQMQKGQQDGPARDLEKALAEGKLDKAAQEIEKLQKKLENKEMTTADREKLQKQLENLQKNLEKSADLKEREEKLKKANLDPETLAREMKRLTEDKKKLQELKELADKLGKCQQCLKEGSMENAAEALQAAGKQLQEMDLNDKDLENLRESLARLSDAMDSAGEGMDQGKESKMITGQYSEENDGGIGAGRRPLGEKAPFKSFEAKQKAEMDLKGKKIFDGYVPGQSYKKKSSVEIEGEIRQAAQDAPEAVEQQRIPRAYRDSAKGYFRNLGGQAETKPEK